MARHEYILPSSWSFIYVLYACTAEGWGVPCHYPTFTTPLYIQQYIQRCEGMPFMMVGEHDILTVLGVIPPFRVQGCNCSSLIFEGDSQPYLIDKAHTSMGSTCVTCKPGEVWLYLRGRYWQALDCFLPAPKSDSHQSPSLPLDIQSQTTHIFKKRRLLVICTHCVFLSFPYWLPSPPHNDQIASSK